MAEQKDVHSSSHVGTQNCNSLWNNHWQENVGSHQKKISHVKGQRRSPNKTGRGAKSRLESNPITARDAWRAQRKPCAQQESPQTLRQTCLWVLSVSCGGTGQQWPASGAGALFVADLGHTVCGTGRLRRGRHEPRHRVAKQTTDKLQNNYAKEILALIRKF